MDATLEKIYTWQMNRLAKGDYTQRIKYDSEFAEAFNLMAQHLEERSVIENKERTRLQNFINMILASTPDMIIVFDTSVSAVLASGAYVKNSIYQSLSQIRGKTFRELFAPVAESRFLTDVQELIDSASVQKRSFCTQQSIDIGAAGTMQTYSIHVSPMLYEGDVLIGVMVVLHDIGNERQPD